MTDLLRGLPRAVTLLIIEHDMDVVFSLADRITVLHGGEVLADGTPGRGARRPARVRGLSRGERRMTPPILEVDGVHTYYGDSHVLQGVSLRVGAGEAVAILGRNGAGKTTTDPDDRRLHAASRRLRPLPG